MRSVNVSPRLPTRLPFGPPELLLPPALGGDRSLSPTAGWGVGENHGWQQKTGWWFQICFIFIPTWRNNQIWLVCFRWVETTNQKTYQKAIKKWWDMKKDDSWLMLVEVPGFFFEFHVFVNPKITGHWVGLKHHPIYKRTNQGQLVTAQMFL